MTEPGSGDAWKQLWSIQTRISQLVEEARQVFESALLDDGGINPAVLSGEQWEKLKAKIQKLV